MKRLLITLLGATTLLSSLSYADENISVIATKFPNGDVLEVAKPILKKEGYNLEIKEIASYSGHGIVTERAHPVHEINDPNKDVVDGKYDANFYEPLIYLEQYNNLNQQNLVNVGSIFYIPFAIYLSEKNRQDFTNINNLVTKKPQLVVGIPNTYIDEARALRLLAANHLIKLDSNERLPNIADIKQNPYRLKIIQVDNNLLPELLRKNDLDMIVINSGRAYLKDLTPDKSILVESSPDLYANVVVTTKEKVNSPKIKALVKALQSEEVKQYITQNFNNTVKSSY